MNADYPFGARLRGVGAIAIGASAGGVTALTRILPQLPRDYPLPIFIVLHLPPDRPSSIPALYQSKCQMTVKEAEDKEPIVPGIAYFAPPNYHLLTEKNGVLSLSSEEPVNYSRPSIDVLFASAADAYSRTLLAIVLTGANHDGAEGLRAVCAAGGLAVVQAPESAEARAMPEAALAACHDAYPMDVARIAELLTITAREISNHATRPD